MKPKADLLLVVMIAAERLNEKARCQITAEMELKDDIVSIPFTGYGQDVGLLDIRQTTMGYDTTFVLLEDHRSQEVYAAVAFFGSVLMELSPGNSVLVTSIDKAVMESITREFELDAQ